MAVYVRDNIHNKAHVAFVSGWISHTAVFTVACNVIPYEPGWFPVVNYAEIPLCLQCREALAAALSDATAWADKGGFV